MVQEVLKVEKIIVLYSSKIMGKRVSFLIFLMIFNLLIYENTKLLSGAWENFCTFLPLKFFFI